MHSSLVLSAALAATVAAFKVPRNLADGTYSVYINSTGHEVHEMINYPSTNERDLNKRHQLDQMSPKWYIEEPRTDLEMKYGMATTHCACDTKIDENEVAEASAELYKQVEAAWARPYSLDNELKAGMSWYSVNKGAVAFICNHHPQGANYDNSGVYVNPDWASDGALYMSWKCGKDHPGSWEHMGGYMYTLGRMAHQEGSDFCAGAKKLSSSECLPEIKGTCLTARQIANWGESGWRVRVELVAQEGAGHTNTWAMTEYYCKQFKEDNGSAINVQCNQQNPNKHVAWADMSVVHGPMGIDLIKKRHEAAAKKFRSNFPGCGTDLNVA